MLNRILPTRRDDDYRGHKLALWIFGVIALMRMMLGLAHMFRADGGAQSVSHIPLDSYPAGAAQNVIAVLARLGLEQFLLGVILIFVLVRYRALIPLMFLVTAVGQIAGFALASYKPLSLTAPSGVLPMHLVILGLTLAGFALSLYRSVDSRPGTQKR